MRLKTALWVAAYLRRCQVEGVSAVVRRRGAEEAGAVFVRICRLDGTSDLFGPAPQSEFDAVREADRAFSPSLKERPAPDEAVEAYLAREVKFDPDVWIVEVEDRAGRNFLDIVAAAVQDTSRRRSVRGAASGRRAGAAAGRARERSSFHSSGWCFAVARASLRSACQIATMPSAACAVISS
jgi:hypothetical protein